VGVPTARLILRPANILAVLAAAAYMIARDNWTNAYNFFYDIPNNIVSARFYADLMIRLVRARPSRNEWIRLGVAVPAAVAGILRQAAGLPVSGHLTHAFAVGLLESGDRTNPPIGRAFALIPIPFVVAVRIHWMGFPPSDAAT
jgi:hypothetical protein